MAEYIEREAALEEIRKLRKLALLTQVDYYNAGVEDAYKAVKAVPVADVAPVRHGRWVDGIRCSECGQVDWTKPNYCPNCGARMDLEEST